MEASDQMLEVVFNALDTDNKGYITTDQFKETFRDFYSSSGTPGRKISIPPSDIEKIVETLDPQNDGIIHFEDFKKVFLDNLDLNEYEESADPSITSKISAFSPNTATNQSSCFSDGLEYKTDDSGLPTQEPSIFDFDNDSALSVDGLHPERLQRSEIRRSWPKHRGNAYDDANRLGSPVSGSRSDILMDGMESNLENIRDRMRRMEQQVQDIHQRQTSEAVSRIDRLREQNAQLSAQVTVLEERLREAEARAQRIVESERNLLQSTISRTNREHAAEVENLRARISALESECSDLRIESARCKADTQASVVDRRMNSEALVEALEQIQTLQQQLKATENAHVQEMEILRRDRDHAVHVLEELNSSMGGRRRSRINSNTSLPGSTSSEVIARYHESQEIVRRLIIENKALRQQLEDAQDQLFARSLEEGRSLVGPTEKSWAAEIDNLTKEEVVNLWTKEKHYNEQLRNYIDSLITRIIERHPSLLEIANPASPP